jgi:hypothetical protein
VEGESLRQHLQRERRLTVAETLRLTGDIADALAYAHSRNTVHRDIKPENVLLVQGRALITDFGIAKVLSAPETGKLTSTGNSIGTPLYMSPEQATASPVTKRTDIYSLAFMVFEMLTGSVPVRAGSPREMLGDKFADKYIDIGMLEPQLAALQSVFAKALASDPDKRHASAGEFLAALTASANVPSDPTVSVVAPARPQIRRVPTRAIAIAAAVVVAVGAGAFAWRAATRPGVASDGRAGVIVMPFRATTAAASQWREAVPDLIATQLDGTPGIRVVDPWSAWRPLRAKADDVARSPDPDEARALAARANACCYVLGSVMQLPGRVDVTIRMYRAGEAEPATFGVSGSPDSIATLVQQVSMTLMQRLTRSTTARNPALERIVPRNIDALKGWLAGREFLRRGELDSADESIGRALAADSNFVPALVDAVLIKSWLQSSQARVYSGLMSLAQRAESLSDSLPERIRLRAEAMAASVRTDGPAVARSVNGILALDNSDFDAANLLSYSHLVYGWQYGATEADIRSAAEHAYVLDTSNVTALLRRAYVAIAANDEADVRVQTERLRRTDTTQTIAHGMLRGIEALGATDAQFDAMMPSLVSLPTLQWIAVFRVIRLYRPERTDAFARATLADRGNPSWNMALSALTQNAMAESNWKVVDSLRSAGAYAQLAPLEQAVDRASVVSALAGTGSADRAGAAVARLAVGLPPSSARAQFNKRNVWHDGWLIGAYNATYGDTALARAWMASLASLPSGGSPKEYARALEADVASRLALRAGDRAGALTHARRAYDLWDIHTELQPETMPEPSIRLNLATLLRDSRPDSAQALFSSLTPPTTWMGFVTARAALELAELQAERGESRAAERSYLLAIRLWERGGADVAPLLARARRGYQRLTG